MTPFQFVRAINTESDGFHSSERNGRVIRARVKAGVTQVRVVGNAYPGWFNCVAGETFTSYRTNRKINLPEKPQ